MHPHQTARGFCRPTIDVNVGTCLPARPRNVFVGRQGAIAPSAGDEGAPMSCFRAQRYKTGRQTGKRGVSGKRRSVEGCRRLQRQIRKKMVQARATKTTRAEKEVDTEDDKRVLGDLHGYVPTGEERWIQ